MDYIRKEAVSLIWDMAQSMPNKSYKEQKNLLDKALIGYLYDPEDDDTEYDWSEKVALNFIKNCTDNQLIVLNVIEKQGNQATLKDLISALGSSNEKSINGSLAGFTRKCDTLDIPCVWDWDENKEVYIINKKAYPYIKAVLNNEKVNNDFVGLSSKYVNRVIRK